VATAPVRPDELRDAERRLAAARRLASVEAELESAMSRRTELWKEQSLNPDPRLSGELRTLSDRINTLWAEARARRATIRGGSRERILRRVRAEARFEREATRTQGGAR
jgi:hypothetical protein